jgi:pyrrolidone-carboxylate peptidase
MIGCKYTLLRHALLIAVLATLCDCRSTAVIRSEVLTDLGADNDAVASRFEAYKYKKKHCHFDSPTKSDYRVMLTGFGPFSGVEFNTSSLVAMNFADRFNQSQSGLISPIISKDDADGITRQDVVTIGGLRVEVCAVSASVIWDLAAAIYLHEAQLFRPNLIIMAGMDGREHEMGTWEHHAVNIAMPSHGYEADGSQSSVTPVSGSQTSEAEILKDGPAVLKMTWNATKLVEATQSIIRKEMPGFDVRTSDEETPGKYLCNNVSYLVLAGLRGVPLVLAGDRIKMQISGLDFTRAGFFHYPWSSKQDLQAVHIWSDVLEAAIRSQMNHNSVD